ncbi:hypothetical protein AMS68_005806 [Peltaster fructicola]|uniref:BAH domain-containing protein n=1 Tax=Peltaster fructicola TaxID=286661 RepID=A0A6H0Y098_9PEZI|nr:hypothetical protein AMS68_005806 [Peltaster fructicola]
MPFTKKRDRSPSSTPVPSTENTGAQLPQKEWDGMTKVLNAIYDYRTEDGFDPSKLFHRKVNKRVLPEYYDTIKEPIALSTIKQKVNLHHYQSFGEFVRDFALIPHNAQVFNRQDSGAFQDALVIKAQLERNLQQLVVEGVIDKATATLPDLGEIPTFEDVPAEDNEEEEEESDDEAEEDEEEDEDEGAAPPKRKRGRPSLHKRDTNEEGGVTKRARGRPPKLLTPMEARIQAVLKGIRKPKNNRGQHMIRHFDRLPDKQVMPEYYLEVKNPMAYDLLKRKVKRKKYTSLEQFMGDVNLMFNNAKNYNTDESQIYKDAMTLQVEAGRLYDIEKAKSDSSFVDDEGKMPMPEGILHNGELYRVGDWVHIQNPNDLTKPIPSQIYRTYRNPSGQAMVNVCWYYRPEQTVHRFDKHFFEHEVVKTGRYKDHHVEEIEGRCFIMFTTRYFKGRPRGLAQGIEIYVCEARYNEEKHLFNKIKTWASCLPDEVRDRDYDMDLYEQPKRMKKHPSPIKYLLRDDQQDTDELPKPTWGADGAPPKIGAVHRRTRTDRDSLPPEPTPPPPPKVPTPPRGLMSQVVEQARLLHASRQTQHTFKPSYGAPQSGAYSQTPQARPPTTQSYATLTPQQTVRPVLPTAPSYSQGPTSVQNTSAYPPRPSVASASSYRDPPPIEVYTLPDQANLSIPAQIREQYRRDEQGRILFFTAPPIIPTDGTKNIGRHSVRWLAAKVRRAQVILDAQEKRKAQEELQKSEVKKIRVAEASQLSEDIAVLEQRALHVLEEQLRAASKNTLSETEMNDLAELQSAVYGRQADLAIHDKLRDASRKVDLVNNVFKDDVDTRIV